MILASLIRYVPPQPRHLAYPSPRCRHLCTHRCIRQLIPQPLPLPSSPPPCRPQALYTIARPSIARWHRSSLHHTRVQRSSACVLGRPCAFRVDSLYACSISITTTTSCALTTARATVASSLFSPCSRSPSPPAALQAGKHLPHGPPARRASVSPLHGALLGHLCRGTTGLYTHTTGGQWRAFVHRAV